MATRNLTDQDLIRNVNGNGNGRLHERPIPRIKSLAGARRQAEPAPKLTKGRQVVSGSSWERFGFGFIDTPHARQHSDAFRMIRDLDPDTSHAIWNYLRLLNPGHDLKAYTYKADGSEDPEEGEGQQLLDDLATRVGVEYGGGLDQLHNVLALMLMTSGAVAMEIVPTKDMSDIEDWYPVEPSLIVFQQQAAKDGTIVQTMGQIIQGQFVPLNVEQVFYQPLDPDVGDPYGRPPLISSVGAVLARAAMLADIRAVAHNQGYPRLDVTVMFEAIQRHAPPAYQSDPEALSTWASAQLQQIVADYSALEVDDTFIHYDYVNVGLVPGAGGGFDFNSLDRLLHRQIFNGLKTLPILLGSNEGTTETHGSIQWQIQISGVNAVQRLLKRVIEKAANTSLQLSGIQAHAKMEYKEVRQVDRLYEAQAESFEANNQKLYVDSGWITNDEAAEAIVGHAAVAEPAAAAPAPGMPPEGGQVAEGTGESTVPDALLKALGQEAKSKNGNVNPPGQGKQMSAMEPLKLPAMFKGDATAWKLWLKQRRIAKKLKPYTDTEAVKQIDAAVPTYEAQGRAVFEAVVSDLAELLRLNGMGIAERSPADVRRWFWDRLTREMKALLRRAIEEGTEIAGHRMPVPESLVERVWKTNEQFVERIADDLKAALRENPNLDTDLWLRKNARREAQMGKYLARQGLTAGWALGNRAKKATDIFKQLKQPEGQDLGVLVDNAEDVEWLEQERLGLDLYEWVCREDEATCETCFERAGEIYSIEELDVIGYPGSDALRCMSNCRCVLDERDVDYMSGLQGMEYDEDLDEPTGEDDYGKVVTTTSEGKKKGRVKGGTWAKKSATAEAIDLWAASWNEQLAQALVRQLPRSGRHTPGGHEHNQDDHNPHGGGGKDESPHSQHQTPADRAVERTLTTARTAGVTYLGGGISESYTGVFDGQKAAIKPEQWTGEQTPQREMASYLVGEVLGINPPVVVLRDDLERVAADPDTDTPAVMVPTSAVIQWVEGPVGKRLDVVAREGFLNGPEGRAMALYDAVIGNKDRHNGNWVVEGATGGERKEVIDPYGDGKQTYSTTTPMTGGRMVPIDHNDAMTGEPIPILGNARTLDRHGGATLTADERTSLERLRDDKGVRSEIEAILPGAPSRLMGLRVDYMLETGRIMEVGDFQSYRFGFAKYIEKNAPDLVDWAPDVQTAPSTPLVSPPPSPSPDFPDWTMGGRHPGGADHDQADHGNRGGSGAAMDTMAAALRTEGGFSKDVVNGESPKSGYVVGVKGHSGVFSANQFMSSRSAARGALRTWLRTEKANIAANGGMIGGWRDDNGTPDTADDKVVFDIVQVIKDRAEAERAGAERGEIAIWDVVNGQEIATGGTGGYRIRRAAR